MTESQRVRQMVIDAAQAAADLISHTDVGRRWEEPSALEGMTVGALVAHLIRATGATIAYLDRSDPLAVPDGQLLDDVTYFHAAIDSPIHDRIKQVSADEAQAGRAELAAKAGDLVRELAERLRSEPDDRLVGALGGRMLTLDDFCRTRMIEIGIHIDDLATSLGVETPSLSADVTGQVIDTLVGIARHLNGDWAVIHALARSERSPGNVFPVL